MFLSPKAPHSSSPLHDTICTSQSKPHLIVSATYHVDEHAHPRARTLTAPLPQTHIRLSLLLNLSPPNYQYLDKKLDAHLKLDWYNEQAVKSEARRQANQPVRVLATQTRIKANTRPPSPSWVHPRPD